MVLFLLLKLHEIVYLLVSHSFAVPALDFLVVLLLVGTKEGFV